MSEIEEWRDIPGYDGYYQASNIGRIRSKDKLVNGKHGLRLRKGKIHKQSIPKDGYPRVSISGRSFNTHRVIANTFLGVVCNMQVNHKDTNKSNNNIRNLEWVTPSQNVRHAFDYKGRYGESLYNCKLDWVKVFTIHTFMHSIEYTSRYFCERYKTSISLIQKVKRGETWKLAREAKKNVEEMEKES